MINTFDELIQKIESDGKNPFCLKFYHEKFIQSKRKMEETENNPDLKSFQHALLGKMYHMNVLSGILEGLSVSEIIDASEIDNIEKDLFGEET